MSRSGSSEKSNSGFRLYFKQAAVVIAAAITCFVIGFALFFPEQALLARLENVIRKNAPYPVTIGSAEIKFPLALAATNIRVEVPRQSGQPIQLDKLLLSPTWSTLIGRPGFSFTAETGGGTINGSLSGERQLNITVSGVRFDEPVEGFSQIRLSGRIDKVQLSTDLEFENEDETDLAIDITDLAVTGGEAFGLPEKLDLGRLSVNATGTGRTLSLQKTELAEGVVAATALGKILIGNTPAASRLNIDLSITPATGLEPSLASLFEMVGTPAPNGSRKLSLRGPLARPSLR